MLRPYLAALVILAIPISLCYAQDAEYYVISGDKCFFAGQYDKAVAEYEKVKNLLAGEFSIYYRLGLAYEKMDDLDKALESFQKSFELNPNHLDTCLHLAIINSYKSDWNKSIQYFKEVSRLQPMDLFYKYCLAEVYFEMGDRQGALDEIKRIREIGTKSIDNKLSLRIEELEKALGRI